MSLCEEPFHFVSACFALKSHQYLEYFIIQPLSPFTEECTKFNGVPWLFPLKYSWAFSSFFRLHLLLH